jgi:hypothetical protein
MARPTVRGESPVALRHRQAQAATLVRAVEEVDRRGELLSLDERRRATEAARTGRGEEPARWLGRRADDLVGVLARDRPGVHRLLRLTDLGRGLLWPTVAATALVGLATNAAGPERQIHVLAVPLLGLVLWNVVVILLGLVYRAVPLLPGSRHFETPRLLAFLEHWARRWVDRRGDDDPLSQRWREALRRYLELWFPAQAPLAAARVRRLLHAGAATMVAGAGAGMYLRGLVLEYRVTWESTFLGGAAVDRILAVVLAPSAAVLGRTVPSAAAAASPEGLPAAEWIHLWAVTAVLFVLAPRGILIAAETVQVLRRRRRTTLSLPDAYLRRLAATTEARVERVDVVPYSHQPSPRALEALEALLHDLFGARAEVRARPFLEYGADPAGLPPGPSRVLLFNLAQTPEADVHGELVSACRDGLPDGQALLAVVDASVYRRRLGETDAEGTRLAERRRAWDRVLGGGGPTAVHLDLEEPSGGEPLAAFERGVWPASFREGGS